ncbi:MAG: M48 family metallopeptidase [Candidatus Omnitrophica bacterium]|nr:M48 family metallopeptidase [Candidatus Omnitrophota bacterium]MCM8817184.1 M48 family metallopeptidase [Candidatus Omnitrophota bacterium]
MIDFFQQQRINKWKTLNIILLSIIILGTIGYAVDKIHFGNQFPAITIVAIFVAVANSIISYFYGDKMVLSSVMARPPDTSNFKEQQLVNVVREMSIASGIPVPAVFVMEEASPNAFATGRDEQHSSICVTTGLLNTMNREELQGVIAHEIGHIRNRDILTMTVVAAITGAIVLLSDWARRNMLYSSRTRKKSSGKGSGILLLIVLILIIIAPLIARVMAMAVSRAREYMADAASAEFTRNPLALASALEKIQQHYDKIVDRATVGTAHLFISDPRNSRINNDESFFANLFSTHPPIHKRIMILKNMAGVV